MSTRSRTPLPPFPILTTGGELRPELDTAFWESQTPRLVILALKYVHGPNRVSDAEDAVQEAVKLILAGKRRRPEDVTPFAFACGVVRSVASHEREKPAARAQHVEADDAMLLENRAPSADDIAEARDFMRRFGKKLSALEKRYVRLRIKEEGATANDLAKKLHITLTDVRNMDKRLWRLREDWGGLPKPAKKTRA